MKNLIVIVVMLALCGCQEQQKQWGQGDLDQAWQGCFGNDNQSRMLFTLKRQGIEHRNRQTGMVG